MGKYNSSIYRVRPLMETIKKDYTKLNELLKLINIDGVSIPSEYLYDGLDCNEKQLKPSKLHLEKLIDYLSKKEFRDLDVKNPNRRKLFFPNEKKPNGRMEARDLALAELDNAYESLQPSCKEWFIFEGFTNPDIFIEGEDYVIVCEGKWTEPHITIETTHLKSIDKEYRNQMVRHIQGALNYTNKKVYAFYIVDQVYGNSYLEHLTKESFIMQVECETIKIEDTEKNKIIDAYKGYTTWQDIQRVIPEVCFKTKEEIL